MPRNGSGTYTKPAGTTAVSGTTIESAKYNKLQDDVATALTNSVARDGQSPMTGNLPMGGNKITNVGRPSADKDVAVYEIGTVTPTLTFFTAGDLAVTYNSRSASYLRIGSWVIARFEIDVTPTFTTASSSLIIGGVLPSSASEQDFGVIAINGSGNAGPSLPSGYSWMSLASVSTSANLVVSLFGSSRSPSTLAASNFTSGNRYVLSGTIICKV
jgi:hypothetical protein